MRPVELILLDAVNDLLVHQVNEYLGLLELDIPRFELDDGRALGTVGARHHVDIAETELSDKERVIRIEAYSVKISISSKTKEHLFYYAAAIQKALSDDVTLGGVAASVRFAHKNYKGANEVVITLRAVMEVL